MLPSAVTWLKGHKDSISSIRLHDQQHLLATASDDGTVRIWSVERQKAVACIAGLPSKRAPHTACFAADNDDVLYVASGRRLLFFDRRCGRIVMKSATFVSAARRGGIACVDAAATNLVVSDDSGQVATLCAADAALLHESVGGEAHGNIASAVAWHPDASAGTFASAGMDGKVVLWDEHCCRRRVWNTMSTELFDCGDCAAPTQTCINPPMALDVQWLRADGAASQCLVGALRNGYLWAGDASSACMGAIETPLSALSCVAAWQNISGSYAAAAGQGSTVLVYSVGCNAANGTPDASVDAVAKKRQKKKVGMRYVSADIRPLGQLECGMRAVNSIAVAGSASLLFVAGTCDSVQVHAFQSPNSSN